MPDPAPSVHAAPVFSAHAEAKAMEALNVVILVHGADRRPFQFDQLVQLHTCITHLVDCLFPLTGDTADLSGSDSLDGNDYVHPIKVAELAVLIGRELGKPRSALIDLATAAALMNVGNLALHRDITEEPRSLLESEWEEHVHKHPALAVTLLEGSGLSDAVILTVNQHHERWDGSGYPAGLQGEQIARTARVLAVADTFVSLRSLRPYRPAVPFDDALRAVVDESGRLFDPEVVEAFQTIVLRYAGVVAAPPRSASAFEARLIAAGGGASPQRRDGRTDDDPETYRPRSDDAGDPQRDRPLSRRPRFTVVPHVEHPRPAPTPPRTVDARAMTVPAAAAPAPIQATRPAATTPTRVLARRRPQRRTLFSTRFYVDSALRGGW